MLKTELIEDLLRVQDLQRTIEQHFPQLWPAVEAGLAACATLLLADNANPTALIYVGPPSSGKTTVAMMFEGAEVNGEPLVYRSDQFTPAAFVSHAANISNEDLEKVDLLPRIQHKVLLTPDLGTVFRGKTEELMHRLSIITRVLDGHGFTSDSGMHGQRGYAGDYLFTWLGCTTPFTDNVWQVMAQLGSRLFFLALDPIASPSVNDLVQTLSQPIPYRERLEESKEAVHTFLDALFITYDGVRGVVWDPDAGGAVQMIARLAELLAVMRSRQGQPESPHRAAAVLFNLARGHALLYGRTQLTDADLPMVARIALSSMPAERRAVLEAYTKVGEGSLAVAQVREHAKVARHTAEQIMKDVGSLGIGTLKAEGVGKATHLVLDEKWGWIITPQDIEILRQATSWQSDATWQKSGDAREGEQEE